MGAMCSKANGFLRILVIHFIKKIVVLFWLNKLLVKEMEGLILYIRTGDGNLMDATCQGIQVILFLNIYGVDVIIIY